MCSVSTLSQENDLIEPPPILSESYNPRPQDVIFKNGDFVKNHFGNHHLCMQILQQIHVYSFTKSAEMRDQIIFSIISTVINTSQSGIFVERRNCNGKDQQWRMMEIGEVHAAIKKEVETTIIDHVSDLKGCKIFRSNLYKLWQLLMIQRQILRDLLSEGDNSPGEDAKDLVDMIELIGPEPNQRLVRKFV